MLPVIEFFLAPSTIDSIYTTVLDSGRISDDKITDGIQTQISNALWLLHKLMLQDEI